MNTLTVTLTSVTLGIIVGVSGTHYSHVKSLVKNPPVQRVAQPDDVRELVAPERNLSANENVLADARYGMDTPQTSLLSRPDKVASNRALEMALEMISTLREDQKRAMLEQKKMRQQLSEANRDLDEVTFRLDTHSNQFRPLTTDSPPPRSFDNAPDLTPLPTDDESVLPGRN